MVDAVDRHADAVEERGRRDDDLGVALAHPVVGDHRRGDAAAEEQPPEAQRDVGDDLDVDPRVVGQPEALGVDARHVPPRLDLQVAVDGVEQLIEVAVAARGRADVDVGQRPSSGCHVPQTSESASASGDLDGDGLSFHDTLSGTVGAGGDADLRPVARAGDRRGEDLRAEAAQAMPAS